MGSNNEDQYAKDVAEQEAKRKAQIEKGTRDVRQMFTNQFDVPFYSGIENDYMNYYTPQLEKQGGDAKSQLAYSLARAGQLRGATNDGLGNYSGGSTVSGDKFADLEEQYNIRRTEIADRAVQSANDRRAKVQSAQEGLINTLQATGDANSAVLDAGNQAVTLAGRDAYEPLGQLFTDASYGLATQADLERRDSARYNTPLPGGSPTSSKSGTVIGG